MRILIIHYHLRPEGVPRVIASQVKVLIAAGHEITVASSGPVGGLECDEMLIPELDYRDEGMIPDELFPEADLWIIHNPTLGLNSGYPAMIKKAAKRGQRILLQCHDFPEDGRPANYGRLTMEEQLYPLAEHVHYAAINRRDFRILLEAGVPEERCHYLPNAVDPPVCESEEEEGLIFYPVRGIRRKNLGEICLLAKHAPAGTRFAVALRSTAEEPPEIHDHWVALATELGLEVEFDVANEPGEFAKWLARASHIVTTSVAEGFGLAFLEPAFLGKPLIGRNLPEITADFEDYGTFYEDIPVPVMTGLAETFREELQKYREAYGMPVGDLDEAWESYKPDFGNLPEDFQERVIREIELPELRQWLGAALAVKPKEVALDQWTLESYGERLAAIIVKAGRSSQSSPLEWLEKERVLTQFMEPGRFHFLRT